MNLGPLPASVTAHLALALYLLWYRRVELPVFLHIYRRTAVWSLVAVPAVVLISYFVVYPFLLFAQHPQLFASVVLHLSVFIACVLAVRHAGEQVIPTLRAPDILFLNIAAGFAVGSNPVAYYLLSPIPPALIDSSLGFWINRLVTLWPTLLVWLAMRRGVQPDLRVKLLLVVWALLVFIVLLAPAAWLSLRQFDGSAPLSYVASLINGLVAVHVALLLLTLTASRNGIAGPMRPAAFIASRYQPGQLPMSRLLVAAAAFYGLLYGLRQLLGPGPDFTATSLLLVTAGSAVLQQFERPQPDRQGAEAQQTRSEALERLWAQRGVFLKLLPVPLLGIWIYADLRYNRDWLQLTPDTMWFAAAIGFVSIGVLLLGLLWIVTGVMDALRLGGRRWVGAARLSILLMGLLLLSSWLVDDIPPTNAFSPPAQARLIETLPVGEIKVPAQAPALIYAVAGGRLYFAPAGYSRFRGPRGLALYLEKAGSRPAVLCRSHASGWVWTHYRVLDATRLECVYQVGDSVQRVTQALAAGLDRPTGYINPVGAGGRDARKPIVREVGENEQSAAGQCRLESDPLPQLRCGSRVQPLPATADDAVWPQARRWRIGASRRYEITALWSKVACLTAEADGSLPDEPVARWPAVVFVRLDGPADEPLTVQALYDDGASCERLSQSNESLYLRFSDLTRSRLGVADTQLLLGENWVQRREVPAADGSAAGECRLLEAPPYPRLRCGALETGLFSRPDGVWSQPSVWHLAQARRSEIRTRFETLVCFDVEAEGAFDTGLPAARWPAIVVARLDEPPGPLLRHDQTFDPQASCARIQFSDGKFPYLEASPVLEKRLAGSSGGMTIQLGNVYPLFKSPYADAYPAP